MANPLLSRVSPRELAVRGQAYEIKAKVQDFARLVDIVEADLRDQSASAVRRDWRVEPVDVKLRFQLEGADGAITVLTGSAATSIAAVCQRCLEPFMLAVSTGFRFRMLVPQDAGDNGGDDDAWELDDGTVRLLDVVEESLIMALPLAAVHREGETCVLLYGELQDDSQDVVRPFAGLRAQMDKSN